MNSIALSRINSVLIIKLRHIGDVLLTAPAFRALKSAIPGVRTTALVMAGTEDMLTLNPDVDEVITIEKGRGLAHNLRLIKKLRAGRFDLAINMTEGDRGVILAYLSGARYRIGIDPLGRGFRGKKYLLTHAIRPVNDGRHKAYIDMDVLAPLGIRPGDAVARLYTSPGDDERIAQLLDEKGVAWDVPLAVVHPTSRWLFKCWRDEGVAEVIDYLEGRGIRVVVTSGPDLRERDRLNNIIGLAKTAPVDLSGTLTLKQLASLIKKARLFFGVDSAPMHMAAAVGTPVVALFGPSDHRLWGPLSPKARVIVKAAEFKCLPCYRDGCDGSKKSRCLDAITFEDVVGAIEAVIGNA